MQENTKNELQSPEEYVYLLVRQMPVAVAMFDRNMNYIITSKKWLEDYHLWDVDIIGRTYHETLPGISERWQALYQTWLEGEFSNRGTDIFHYNNGHIDWIKWESCPWYTSKNVIGGIILFTDIITEQKLIEENLGESNELSEEKISECGTSLIKALKRETETHETVSRFVSGTDEELRAPLSTLLSSLFLLEQYIAPKAKSREAIHIDKIRTAAYSVVNIINECFLLSQLRNGEYPIDYELFNMKQLGQNVIYTVSGSCKNEQKLFYDYNGPVELFHDKKTLTEILYKLLTNVIKFSEPYQTIVLNIDVDNTELKLHVGNDTCVYEIGCSQCAMGVTNIIDITEKGEGLGILKKCIELMRGSIIARDNQGKGMCFIIKIPIRMVV